MELNFDTIFTNAKNSLLCVSIDFKILEFNKEAERNFGLKRDDVIGKNFLNLFVAEEFHKKIIKKNDNLLDCKIEDYYLIPLILSDNKKCYTKWNIKWLINLKNQVYGIISFNNDFIKQEKFTYDLANSDYNWRSIIMNGPENIAISDHEGIILFYNKTELFPNIFILGTSIYDYLSKENQKIVKKNLDYVIETGDSNNYQIEMDFFGKNIWLDINMAPLKEGDKMEFVLFFYSDITNLKKLEQKIKVSEEKFSVAFHSSSALMAISTIEEGKFIEVNDRFLETLKFEKNEVIGKTSKDLGLFMNYDERTKLIKQMKEEGSVKNAEIQMNTKYENIIVGLFSADTIKFNDKSYLLTTMIDITKRKEIELKLKDSEKKYHKAYNLSNFYKDLFTHDINNILQSIISTSEYYNIIKNDHDKMKDFGDISQLIKNHAKRGSFLVSNVRKLSNLDEIEMSFKPIDVSINLNEAINNIKNGFQKCDIDIKINDLFIDSKVLGNELLIDVFDNLLNNAVKYRKEKTKVIIEISCSRILEDGIPYLKFEFIDNGIGVPDDKKVLLFQRQTIENISERGMGMGLSLVKKIVDKYGGRIWVEDKVKGDFTEGSKFILMLKES